MPSTFRTTAGLLLACIFAQTLTAQPPAKTPATLPVFSADSTKPRKAAWPLADKTKGSRRTDGLFSLFQDTANGGVQLYIRKAQVGKEYIYQSFALSGPTSLLLNQSIYRSNFIFRIDKAYDRIELSRVNTAFYYDPANPVSRTKNVDKPDAVLLSERIVGEDSAGYLINADGLYLGERFDPVKPASAAGIFSMPSFSLGNLNPFKSKYVALKTFPGNTDVIVDLAYDNPNAVGTPGKDVTDPRYVRVRLQHSFIELPANNFVPRRDDPRVGYFAHQVNDQTSISATPYRDVIDRWHLVKKDPAAALSEPVEPIVFWIENTTPYEYRSTIREAILKWNGAFREAGFLNAIRVEEMPDSADWDPSDLRYNVVRWVSSANPPYGAIGQYTTNPRTGQILGADVTIEWYTASASPAMEELLVGTHASRSSTIGGAPEAGSGYGQVCNLADDLKTQFFGGSTALEAEGADSAQLSTLHRQFLTYLIMHEIGHTLGLNHNMKGSQLWSPAQLNDTTLTHKWGLLGSVMDYPAVNIASNPKKQGDFYTTKEGPYDDWAIAFGYTTYADSASEAKGQATILAKSKDPRLAFGNDADDMRTPGKGMDPRANIDDLSSDAMGYAATRLQALNGLMPQLVKRYSKPGQSWAELRARYASLQAQRQQMIGAVSRYVGGVYIDRSFPDQHSATKPFTPVPLSQQKRAISLLNKFVFAPDAWMADTVLLPYLQPQRRGFSSSSYGDDYKTTSAVLSQQFNGALAHLLHPATLQRITNSRLYGNRYSVADLLQDLEAGIFAADRHSAVNVYRQNLQTEYTRALLSIISDPYNQYDGVTQAAALQAVQRIRRQQAAAPSPNAETRAHRNSLVFLIGKALDEKQ